MEMDAFNSENWYVEYNTLGYNRETIPLLVDRERWKCGFIYTRKYGAENPKTREWYYDDDFFSPYILYRIGGEIGIDVPETELKYVSYINQGKRGLSDSYTQSSIVYDPAYKYLARPLRSHRNMNYVSQEVVYEEYLNKYFEIKDKLIRKMPPGLGIQRMQIDEYINANLEFLKNNGCKSSGEYTENEINDWKQELITRALLGLRLGIHGHFNIVLTRGESAKLGSYFLASDNMFCLRDPEMGVQECINMSDEELHRLLNKITIPQYYLYSQQDLDSLNSGDVIRYIYENYPEEAERAYNRLSKFTTRDLEEVLEECSGEMSDSHKMLALRIFEMRAQEFDQIHQQQIAKGSTLTEPTGEDR